MTQHRDFHISVEQRQADYLYASEIRQLRQELTRLKADNTHLRELLEAARSTIGTLSREPQP